MYQDRKAHNSDKKSKQIAQKAAYEEMTKVKPRQSAVEAFKHKPYGMGGVHSELGRQGTEKAQDS